MGSGKLYQLCFPALSGANNPPDVLGGTATEPQAEVGVVLGQWPVLFPTAEPRADGGADMGARAVTAAAGLKLHS